MLTHSQDDRTQKPRWRRPRRALLAVAALGACAALTAAPAMAASAASTAPSAGARTAAVNYGEFAQFHCSSGLITFDNIRLPYRELPVVYAALVYRYTSSGWQFYGAARTADGRAYQVIQNPVQEVYYEAKMYLSVPHGYYRVYAYVVPNQAAGYVAHYDPATISLGYPGAGTAEVCQA
jgi:hypothetical protein